MSETGTPIPSNPEIDRHLPFTWSTSDSTETGGVYSTPRVKPKFDKIRATHINELRQEVELLMRHTHEFTSSSSGGGTTTCG